MNTRRASGLRGRPGSRPRNRLLSGSLPATWLSNEAPGLVPGLPVPPYQGAPFLLVRDGRDPLAFADCRGSWLEWLPATGEEILKCS